MRNLHRAIPIGLAVASAAVLATPLEAPAAGDDLATLRAEGPAGLETLLASYDRLPAGPARDRLAKTIDAVAAQRYATVSRLYWYTDLEQAKAAARGKQQPILALRMLGRLDEDLSCANSRLFRSTLYANTEVASFLRNNFVLYWSSERPVPRVTIDFGDGRKLERTTTGNSAHYVLDDRGRVLDVLPGLYAPRVFRAELAKSVQLARKVRKLDDAQRAAAIVAFHKAGYEAADQAYRSVAGTQFIGTRNGLMASTDFGASAVQRAQQATMAKYIAEAVDLAAIGYDVRAISPDDLAQWTAIGQQVWNIMGEEPAPAQARQLRRTGSTPRTIPASLLDAPSRALVTHLHTAGGTAAVAPAELQLMLARLAQSVIADTALNELRLRQQIRWQLTQAPSIELAKLNDWIYARVFHTPKQDAWLGLLPRTDFTGLPGDGVVMR